MARQPILDARLGLVGYELLFRDAADATDAHVVNAEQATSCVIADAIGELGLDCLVAGHPAFVNVSRELLLAVRPLPLPADAVVLELLEDQVVDGELVAVARELVRDGFTLALDDFVYDPSLEPLIDLARIVKLDVPALGADGVREDVARLRGRGVRLLAEKVETYADYKLCRDMGLELFQGFFFARPELVRGLGVPADRLGALATLSDLQRAGACFERVEAVISRDVALSYKLLRYANSASVGARAAAGTVRAALVRLGTRTVRQWATILVLAGVGHGPPELMTTALLRARTCQLLVGCDDADLADRAFTTGLFSVLDALLLAPMDEILDALPLDPGVAGALLERSGTEGAALAAVLEFEAGAAAPPPTPHSFAAVGAAYREALEWTRAATTEIAGRP